MKQMMFAAAGFERYGKTTRRSSFLAEMEPVVPWRELCRLIEVVQQSPAAGGIGNITPAEAEEHYYFGLSAAAMTASAVRSASPWDCQSGCASSSPAAR